MVRVGYGKLMKYACGAYINFTVVFDITKRMLQGFASCVLVSYAGMIAVATFVIHAWEM